MSLTQILRLIGRRWPVLVIGALLTGALAYVAIQDRVTYFARTEVVFMAPSSTLYPNSLKTTSEDLIITAGAVAKRVMGPEAVVKYSSPDADLVGIPPTGRDYWVRLPDSGGQWAPHFAEQLLLVDVVGATPDEVRATQEAVIGRIRSELYDLQREQDVDPVNFITVKVAPEVTVVDDVEGSTVRALGMTLLLGGAATTAVVVALEIAATRRSTRRVRIAEYTMTHTAHGA